MTGKQQHDVVSGRAATLEAFSAEEPATVVAKFEARQPERAGPGWAPIGWTVHEHGIAREQQHEQRKYVRRFEVGIAGLAM